jgi:outer membrane protein
MLFCLLGFGAPSLAADLLEVYRQAQQQDATFAAAKAARAAGIEALPQGRSTLLPTIGMKANRTHNKYDGAGMDMDFIGRSWGLTLTQPLFNWQYWAQYKQGEAAARQAEVQFAAAQQDLMVRAAQAYFDVLLAQDNVELQRAQKAAIAEQLEQAKISFEVGTATITDANNAQASYDLVNAQEIAAVNDLEVKRRTLQVLIGQYPELLKPLTEKLPLAPPEPAVMDKWVERADLQNLQVLAQQEGYEMARQAVEINRAGHIPSLDLVAGRNQSDTALTGMPINGTVTADQVGLQVNIPIFQGGYVSSRVRQAAANFEQAKQNLEYAKRQADLLARQSFLGVTNGIAQVKALEQALVSNQSSLDSTVLGQEVGVRTSVDVLNARQQLYNAKYNLAQARYNYVMSRLKLKSAVGTLSEDDLAEVNRWLVAPQSPAPSPAPSAENPSLAAKSLSR